MLRRYAHPKKVARIYCKQKQLQLLLSYCRYTKEGWCNILLKLEVCNFIYFSELVWNNNLLWQCTTNLNNLKCILKCKRYIVLSWEYTSCFVHWCLCKIVSIEHIRKIVAWPSDLLHWPKLILGSFYDTPFEKWQKNSWLIHINASMEEVTEYLVIATIDKEYRCVKIQFWKKICNIWSIHGC